MTAPTRVLIVDDSASMRAALQRILSSDPDIEVIGLAFEPNMARAMIKELNPDVLTLDIEMPGMDGLAFLEKIMRLRPMPVVMCSTLTARGAEATITALRLGAVDCIAKPSGSALEIGRLSAELCAIVKAAANATVRSTPAAVERIAESRHNAAPDSIIAIGASTGGVEALFSVLSALPADCPPVLVVQHMPAAYTAGFAARLNKECDIRVVEARDASSIERGTVYIAPGGETHMMLAADGPGRINLGVGPAVSGHRPSVDMLFHSIARRGRAAVGVILTGMGSDGADGLLEMRKAGSATIGQDRASSVVYGMPRVAYERGAVASQLPLSAIPQAIMTACRK
jgi:two-component system, chemotaxis family, protein-glutamate methylesterase/glutaminase